MRRGEELIRPVSEYTTAVALCLLGIKERAGELVASEALCSLEPGGGELILSGKIILEEGMTFSYTISMQLPSK